MYNTKLSLHDGILCAATLATMFFFAVGVINISAKKKKKKKRALTLSTFFFSREVLEKISKKKKKKKKNGLSRCPIQATMR